MYSASNQPTICIKWPRNLHHIARQSDANHTVYQYHVMLLLLLFFIINWLTILYKLIQNSRISDRNAFIFQHAPSCESICKIFNRYPPPAPPKEGSANLRSLPWPLSRRGVRTCKEISYNSLRNYTSCIVHYELTTIQHFTFHIKKLCIMHCELWIKLNSTLRIPH